MAARRHDETNKLTVWLVETGGCMDNDHDIQGVFSSREKAVRWARDMLNPSELASITITEMIVDDLV
jgi:hypothetical protein